MKHGGGNKIHRIFITIYKISLLLYVCIMHWLSSSLWIYHNVQNLSSYACMYWISSTLNHVTRSRCCAGSWCQDSRGRGARCRHSPGCCHPRVSAIILLILHPTDSQGGPHLLVVLAAEDVEELRPGPAQQREPVLVPHRAQHREHRRQPGHRANLHLQCSYNY